MDLKLIRNLVRIMERGEVSELEIDDEKAGLRIHLRRGDSHAAAGHPVVMVPGTGALPPQPAGGDEASGPLEGGRDPSLDEITSPMVGTFYRATSPGAEAFTAVGNTVGEDSVVCIIEAMKVMNEIKAEMNGKILAILVENGEPVEFGQPLFRVER